MSAQWPVTLTEGLVTLRPIRRRDRRSWEAVRRRNLDWLRPWEPTQPIPTDAPPPSFTAMVAGMRSEARAGRMIPWVLTYEGRLVGQLTMGGITLGSLRGAHIGYWLDKQYAGHGLMPLGVAMAVDHAFGPMQLHRMEINMRVENHPSRRVVEKLGFRFEGVRPRFLHIDGQWRDHLVYAMHTEDAATIAPQGFRRLIRDTPSAFHDE
ncbi:MAG: GNAT family protein [Actinomycetes bacterium]